MERFTCIVSKDQTMKSIKKTKILDQIENFIKFQKTFSNQKYCGGHFISYLKIKSVDKIFENPHLNILVDIIIKSKCTF